MDGPKTGMEEREHYETGELVSVEPPSENIKEVVKTKYREATLSDVVVRGRVPPQICKSIELWVGCVAGALEESEYRGQASCRRFRASN